MIRLIMLVDLPFCDKIVRNTPTDVLCGHFMTSIIGYNVSVKNYIFNCKEFILKHTATETPAKCHLHRAPGSEGWHQGVFQKLHF